jgi:hypothetical protein
LHFVSDSEAQRHVTAVLVSDIVAQFTSTGVGSRRIGSLVLKKASSRSKIAFRHDSEEGMGSMVWYGTRFSLTESAS